MIEVLTIEDVDRHVARITEASTRLQTWVAGHQGDGMTLLRRMKFQTVGFHPIDHRPLNLVEQINQTWTHLVALEAARRLLERHPDAGGFRLAPGAHAAQALDVMSIEPGLVGAETFAAVDVKNNKKLRRDLEKLALRPERHRYAFFMCPTHAETALCEELGRDGIQVWSIHV